MFYKQAEDKVNEYIKNLNAIFEGETIMSGVTKHIFEHDIRDILTMWNKEIKTTQSLLPRRYSLEDIINLLKKFYPYEWRSVGFKYKYYHIKDRHIKKSLGNQDIT